MVSGIKDFAYENNVTMLEISNELNISEDSLRLWMTSDLSKENESKILLAIGKIVAERNNSKKHPKQETPLASSTPVADLLDMSLREVLKLIANEG